MTVFLVWNENRSECVGFTDKNDAYQAAGLAPAHDSASTLAEFFRGNYADEDIFECPEKVFDVTEVTV